MYDEYSRESFDDRRWVFHSCLFNAYLMVQFPSDEDQLGHNLAFHNLRFLRMAVLKAWILSINTYGSLYHQFLVNVPNPRTKDKKSVLLLL